MGTLDPWTVHTRDDLAEFLTRLSLEANRRLETFENQTLERYFDAASAVVTGLDEAPTDKADAVPDHPTWGLVAQIFLAATAYE